MADGRKSPAVRGLLRVDPRGQGGLPDVEVGPDYERRRLMCWTYYVPRERGNGLPVAHAQLHHGSQRRVDNVRVIFRMQPTIESTMHAGGRLARAPDATLFVMLGDRAIMPGRVQARDLDKGRLREAEMGPRGADELNRVEAGSNYRWPSIGYGEEYSGRPIRQATQAPACSIRSTAGARSSRRLEW